MAKIIFGSHAGLIVLPIMLFHQIQLMTCSVLAQRWALRADSDPAKKANGAQARRTEAAQSANT